MWSVGTEAHCRRVAAWSGELARALGLAEPDRQLIEQAASEHHLPDVLSDDASRLKLLTDLRISERPDSSDRSDLVDLLSAFHASSPGADGKFARLATLLDIGHDFDRFFESRPFASAEEQGASNSAVETMLSYLQITSRADIGRVIDRLPVFPRAAQEAVRFASDPASGPRDLERAASRDQVLAASLLQTANSAYYAHSYPISTIGHAIAYLGLDTTRKVMLAGALRVCFAAKRHQQLWNHSLEVGQVMEQLAKAGGTAIHPAEAFLAGLVHDIGSLAFTLMPPIFLERFYRLTSRGCPPVAVEICLAGMCHSEVGAEALRQWRFPEALVEAVRWHHQPERCPSRLASLLYLGEFCTDSDEDLPSCIRLNTAQRQTGVDIRSLNKISGQQGYLDALRFAA